MIPVGEYKVFSAKKQTIIFILSVELNINMQVVKGKTTVSYWKMIEQNYSENLLNMQFF